MEVQLVSTETIKPSSPTPIHLQHYNFSFLDQINPPVFMPLLLFYPYDSRHDSYLPNRLKDSLSLSLSRFYPLAGRVVDNSHIDCADQGVPYFEARANCDLSDVVSDPVPGELNRLLPCELYDVRDLPAVVQVTSFKCGGLAVGLGISHKVADALSFFMFLTTWAAIARGDTDLPSPKFESAKLFPPRDIGGFNHSTGIVKEGITTRRFVFTADKIKLLRDRYTEKLSEYETRPTRIEALSAFIWSRLMASTRSGKAGPNTIHTLLHAVNLRTRVDPPLSSSYFGNISRLAVAVPSPEDRQGVVDKVREAIRTINGDYVAKLREGDKHLSSIKDRAERFTRGDIVSFSFTSLCRFPTYEADFGWGRPVWVGSASLNFKNLVVFMDTASGDGIEAWVNLKEEDMDSFQADEEFLGFVSSGYDDKCLLPRT